MLSYNTNTPILLLIFNRPNTTIPVFSQIRKMKPTKLYIAADSPRYPEEKYVCEQARNIVSSVDWECDISTLFRENHLGYGQAVNRAISWFFDKESEGIILEDDCLPSDSFFGFCSYMLEKYRNDERIGHINGSNFQNGIVRGDGSYYFSLLPNHWGWAGWRRVWKDYNLETHPYHLFEKMKHIEKIQALSFYKDYWYYRFNIEGSENSWDFQYFYLNFINNRLCIVPNSNLIRNIGCYENPTHLVHDHPFSDLPISEIAGIEHPSVMIVDTEADKYAIYLELMVDPSEFHGNEFVFIKDKLTSIIPEKDNFMRIPKIIHQIFFDSDGVPNDLSVISQTWKQKHPEWEYRFWNKIAVEQFLENHFRELIPLYRSFPFEVQRWDFVRYLILNHFGGLYVDMDYECLEPIDVLLWNSSCCMGLEPAVHAIYNRKPFIIGNAFMASVPEHDFLNCIINEISSRGGQHHQNAGTLVLETTGAFMLNRVYESFDMKEDVTFIPAELVTPLSMEETQNLIEGYISKEMEKKIEKSFAIHYYYNSWIPQIT